MDTHFRPKRRRRSRQRRRPEPPVLGRFSGAAVLAPAVEFPAPPPVTAAESSTPRRLGGLRIVASLLMLGAGLAAGIFIERRLRRPDPPATYRQLTFGAEVVGGARFVPDERTIVYSTELRGRPWRVLTQPIGSLESRPLIEGAALLGVSSTGELALSLNSDPDAEHWIDPGTLARASLTGVGAPRPLAENVLWADWSPDGRELAVVRSAVDSPRLLEYPIGHVLVRKESGFLSHPRVSRRGDLVAFLDHPLMTDDRGVVCVVDRKGRVRKLSQELQSAWGLVWSPDGNEIWFSGSRGASNRIVYGLRVAAPDRLRVVASAPGSLQLEDVSPSGRALVIDGRLDIRTVARTPGARRDTDLTWLDMSVPRAISDDGSVVLFVEAGAAGGPGYTTYLRKTDGSPAVRLGEGDAVDLTPDGKWALAVSRAPDHESLILYPTGVGELRKLRFPGLAVNGAAWFPEADRILLTASQSGRPTRLYVADVAGGPPRPVGDEGFEAVEGRAVSPDATLAVVRSSEDRRFFLQPLDGSPARPLPGIEATEVHCGWTADGRLFLAGPQGVPLWIDRYDSAHGKARALGRDRGRRGIQLHLYVRIAPNGGAYVYGYTRFQANLHLVEGLR